MKLTQNDDDESVRSHTLPVHFEFAEAEDGVMPITGIFNDWPPDDRFLCPVAKHRWLREIILPVGTKEYQPAVKGSRWAE